MIVCIQSYVVSTAHHTILVDVESFVTQKLPVPTGLANRLLPAAAFVLCTQKSKPGRIQP
jgi:hypothetical protein